MDLYSDLIVFSHLRWDFVYQRPQHLMARLQKNRRVFFIEEPIFQAGCAPHWQCSEEEQNLVVCRPVTPVAAPGFSGEQVPFLHDLVGELLEKFSISDHVVWFYTPMALPLIKRLSPEAIVYDCMDELSAFMHAPREMLESETRLLNIADLVFTGGPSLYRAKKDRHPRVYCLPSSVDSAHFEKASNGIAEAADQASLPSPRLGFFGVIDERFDIELLEKIARAHPDWQLIMVGPIVKIDPAKLPHLPNIHYLGQRDYSQLPHYLKGWDVCLLPFALNDSTRFISPTKTLEYMAARKMIVSTMITDVAEPYRGIVYLGESHEGFIAACERALEVSDGERANRLRNMEKVLASTSWDATAQKIEKLLNVSSEGQNKSARTSILKKRLEPITWNDADGKHNDPNGRKKQIDRVGPLGAPATAFLTPVASRDSTVCR